MSSSYPDALHAGRYLELVSEFPLRPIRSDEGLVRAIAAIDALLAKGDLDDDERDYLDVLSDLVEKFEAEDPFPPASDAEMLRHLIEAREITQVRLAADTGIANSTISSVLAGRRGLTREQVDVLARYFKVSPAVFVLA